MAYAHCMCGRVMKKGGGCAFKFFEYEDGEILQRIPNSEEDICHDCNAKLGEMHHPGCDMEKCPRCGRQAISCDCRIDMALKHRR